MHFQLFGLFARPLSEYCTPLWSPQKSFLIEEVEKLQKSFTHRCFCRCGLSSLSYDKRLSRLNADSLEFRFKVSDFRLLLQLTTDEICFDIYDLFEAAASVGIFRVHLFRIRPEKPDTINYERFFFGTVGRYVE